MKKGKINQIMVTCYFGLSYSEVGFLVSEMVRKSVINTWLKKFLPILVAQLILLSASSIVACWNILPLFITPWDGNFATHLFAGLLGVLGWAFCLSFGAVAVNNVWKDLYTAQNIYSALLQRTKKFDDAFGCDSASFAPSYVIGYARQCIKSSARENDFKKAKYLLDVAGSCLDKHVDHGMGLKYLLRQQES